MVSREAYTLTYLSNYNSIKALFLRSAPRPVALSCSSFNFLGNEDALTLLVDSPGAMALAATGSVDLVEKVTEASAAEMKTAGLNWV